MFVDVARQVIVENIKFEYIVMVFNLSKKDSTTGRALKTKLFFNSFGRYFSQIACVGITLQ